MSGMSRAWKSKKRNVLLVTLSVRSVSAEHMCEWLVYVDDSLQSAVNVAEDATGPLLLFIVWFVSRKRLHDPAVSMVVRSNDPGAQVLAACCRDGLLGSSFLGS